MSIVLFSIIGASIKAGTAYWICFGIYCLFQVLKVVIEIYEKTDI